MCGKEFTRAIKAYGMNASMTRIGDCWDNAPTESLWGSLKVGRLHCMKFAMRRAAMDAMVDWLTSMVDWLTFYNHRRLHSTLGYVSPMQFERAWLAALQRQDA
jgi:transposase InsO family protein